MILRSTLFKNTMYIVTNECNIVEITGIAIGLKILFAMCPRSQPAGHP